MPQVTVTQYTKDRINFIKESDEHTSVDSVIRFLMACSNYEFDSMESAEGENGDQDV